MAIVMGFSIFSMGIRWILDFQWDLIIFDSSCHGRPAAYCHFEGRSSRRICGSDTLQALGPGTSAQTLMA